MRINKKAFAGGGGFRLVLNYLVVLVNQNFLSSDSLKIADLFDS